jgi:hypothetical protein
VLRELLDRVSAVAQDALLAVDERDRAAARARVAEAGSSVISPVELRSFWMSTAASSSVPRTTGMTIRLPS